MHLQQAMLAIHAHELELNRALLEALQSVPGLTVYGLTDIQRLEERVPTFSFRLNNLPPRSIAENLARQGLFVWDGNYYALNVTEQLGLENKGGMVRVGAVHYNTLQEVDRLKSALIKISKEKPDGNDTDS
jgi:selenocysteine lyase/cysteine desulfurase